MVFKHSPTVANYIVEKMIHDSRSRGVAVSSVTVELPLEVGAYSAQGGLFDFGLVAFFGRRPSRAQGQRVNYSIVRVGVGVPEQTTYQFKRRASVTDHLSRAEEIGLIGSVYGLIDDTDAEAGPENYVIVRLSQVDSEVPVAYLNQHGFWIRPEAKNLMPIRRSTRFEGLKLVSALEDYFGMPAEPSLDTLDRKLAVDTDLLFWYNPHIDSKSRLVVPLAYRKSFELSDLVLEQVYVPEMPAIRVVGKAYFEHELSGEPVPNQGEILYQRLIELAQRISSARIDVQGRLSLPKRCREFLGVESLEDDLLVIGSGDPNYFFVTLRKYFPDVRPRRPHVQLPLPL